MLGNVGGTNYWTCMNEGVQKNLAFSVRISLQKARCLSSKAQELIYVTINSFLLDYIEMWLLTWHQHQLSDFLTLQTCLRHGVIYGCDH